jgi:ribonuclease-3
MKMNLNKLQEILGVKFNNVSLLKEALTPPSYANENNCPHNQRLEYLGDAVIELAMSTYLYDRYRSFDEGDMTKRRAQSVCEEALVIYAEKFNLSSFMLLGHGEELKGGRGRASLIADTFEAILGAIYLDQGFNVALDVFNRLVLPYIDEVDIIQDYKTKLQELVRTDRMSLIYEIVNESGPAHDKTFEAIVKMENGNYKCLNYEAPNEIHLDCYKNILEDLHFTQVEEV